MNITILLTSIISFFSIIISLTLGIYIFIKKSEDSANLIYYKISFIEGIYFFTELNMRIGTSFQMAYFWLKVGFFWPIILAMNVHFAARFAQWKFFSTNRIGLFLLYVPAILFSGLILFTNSITGRLYQTPFGWNEGEAVSSLIYNVHIIWVLLIAILPFVISWSFFYRNYKQHNQSQIKQSLLLSMGLSLPLLNLIIQYVLVMKNIFILPTISISLAVGNCFIFWGIKKYSLFGLTPISTVQDIIDSMGDSLIVTYPDGLIAFTNEAAIKLTGYDASELKKNMIFQLLIENGQNDLLPIIKQETKTFCTVLKTKFGSVIPVSVTFSQIISNRTDRIDGLIWMVRDITEQKRIENELIASKEWFETTLNSIGDAVIVTDTEEKILFMNPVAEEVTEWPINEVIGEKLETIFNIFNEDTGEKIENPITKVLREGIVCGLANHTHLITKAGTKVPIDDSSAPIKTKTGEILGAVLVFRDVSDHKEKEKEKEKILDQMHQMQKLESIGTLAAGIAHEMNTPLQFIGDNLQFIKQSMSEILTKMASHCKEVKDNNLDFILQEVPNAITQSQEGVETVSRIVRAMKDFSHQTEGEEKTCANINTAIQSTVTISRNEWKYCSEVELNLDSDLPLLNCYIQELKQVFLNMIINAAHAIKEYKKPESEKGKIIIETKYDKDYIYIYISDTGKGIPEAIQSKIFDPFFTTKPVGVGTGQGLAISYNIIVKKHGGSITFSSEVNQGTRFSITLPRHLESKK